jgi:hypothetical protein
VTQTRQLSQFNLNLNLNLALALVEIKIWKKVYGIEVHNRVKCGYSLLKVVQMAWNTP